MNPQHTVPTLDDNGIYLSDSHAIATYLIGKFGNSVDHPLYPKDLYTRARIDQRLHFESGILFQSLIVVIRSVLHEGAVGINESQLKDIQAAYVLLETFLAVDAYLVGDQLTVADLSIVTTLTTLNTLVELDSAKYPRIRDWLRRIETLPYYYETNTAHLAQFKEFFNSAIASNQAN